uniref:Uncharacterized protein n=2 Tax=root TaxID=1 RepID=H5SL86_9ZZZZ|nr:hypothetical protein HGMM_F45C08C33 [uncultured prokaryote]
MDLRAGETATLVLQLGRIPPGLEADLQHWGDVLARADNRLTLRLAPGRRPADLARWIVGQGLDLEAMIPQRLSLEEMFLQIVGMEMG